MRIVASSSRSFNGATTSLSIRHLSERLWGKHIERHNYIFELPKAREHDLSNNKIPKDADFESGHVQVDVFILVKEEQRRTP